MPAALKAIGAVVALAVVFIVAAVLGGGSGGGPTPSAPAPAGAPGPGALGYPALATANTTRIAGADPVARAAEVALAVYPSTGASQRPAAVTVVDAAEWQAAIAASVLMAAPLNPPEGVPESAVRGAPAGAPLLISEANGVPAPTARALAALHPRGSAATGGTQVFAIGAAAVPSGFRTRRVAAGGPAAEAAAIADLRDALFVAQPARLVIASDAEPGFAMPAAAWAAHSGDPVLLTGPERLPGPTAAVLRQHPRTPVYVLGPPAAISARVVHQIAAIDGRVRRVAGASPAANAIALARYRDGGFGWNVNDPGHGFVVARSDQPLDAAAAAPLSAAGAWGPLLLTEDAARLPGVLRGYLLDVKPGYTTDPTRAFYNHVWLIGDEAAIDLGQQAEIDTLAALAKIGGGP